ncbi:DUF6206 family protein [Roseicyclus mahoneyensis]|uniref:Aminoglycoside phosphotransferase domain-containing protein n=1 Tax=Roseicyclus mahoneyensis TaxID=164332 RepID=A0A316GCZ0_9RHOB|nr:DUF6206 family protein [Roseicyclus mahoneyensis]PWK57340.1 hypothetical protein C7455_11267 [Roseicyclus mahoneyensis]
MTDLSGAVREALRARGEPVSRLGYFCVPFRPAEGVLKDKVIKTYRGGRDPEVLEQLARRHTAYVDLLTWAGVRLPETRFLILNEAGYMQPVIVQDALDEAILMRPQIEAADLPDALALLEGAAASIADFWGRVAQRPERIGYHPSIRNFAYDAEGPIFFDTFPPLIGYSREDMGKLLLRFSESGLVRGVGTVMPGRIRAIQDEWYSPAGTIVGLFGSAVRLRPEDGPAILDWARGFAAAHLDADLGVEVLAELDRPPRLPAFWTGMRRVLGLEGKPNV